MPVVTISTLKLLENQKINIAKKVTEILAAETQVPKDKVYVLFSGFPMDGIAVGGVLNSELPPEARKMFVTKDSERLGQEDSVYVIQRLKAKRGQEENARQELMKLLHQARAVKGCNSFDLYRSCIDLTSGKLQSSIFVIRENWQDLSSMLDFASGADYQAFFQRKVQLFEDEDEKVKRISPPASNLDNFSGRVFLSLRMSVPDSDRNRVREELLESQKGFESRAGCLNCEIYQADNNVFYIQQVWEDAEALNNGEIKKYADILHKRHSLPESPEILVFNKLSAPVEHLNKNAVAGDTQLMAGLRKLNPDFGELCVNASKVPWGMPLIDQKTKVLIAIAIDVVEQITGKPFENHISMALKQGITRDDLEELFLFMTVYAGFNKAGVFYAELERIFGPKENK